MKLAHVSTSFLIALGSMAASTEALARGDGEGAKPPEATRSEPSTAARLALIKAEYAAAIDRARQAVEKVDSQAEASKLYGKMLPDDVAYSRRMVELALTAQTNPAARDALVWVVDHAGRSDNGPFGDEYARAAALLVRHHGDDPEAVRVGLGIDNLVSPHRDALLYGFLAAAKGRESMGLARLALAQYLEEKAKFAQGTRNVKARSIRKLKGVMDADGKLVDRKIEQPAEDYAYILALRECDPAKLRVEAERLYEEVVSEYSDVPHVTINLRELEALVKEPNPTWNGKPLTEDERRQLAELVARKKTLGQVAEGRLDEMHNLTVGKPAPEIDGVDFTGKPLKLSDYRSKVVVLVFWGTWCGPCMGEVPRERALVERMKGRPFAMLGIDCNDEKEKASKVMAAEGITWPNWHDGSSSGGPIAERYHVRGFPTILVLDDRGIIRHKGLRGEWIDLAVEELLKGMESK